MRSHRPTEGTEIILWDEKTPTTLTPYWPEKENALRPAMIVLPGGAYEFLAEHEDKPFAKWFTAHGISAFVLHYRLATQGYKHPAMQQDAARALRYVRSHAVEWGIDPNKIGIIGCSAGGHLTVTAATHFDAGDPQSSDPVERVSSRPDVAIVCYAVVTMLESSSERTMKNLLGDNPSLELKRYLSAELQVTTQTPPCFVWHTGEDAVVPVENAFLFASALRRNNVPFDLHIYQKGDHGVGLTPGHPWMPDCEFWLREQKFL